MIYEAGIQTQINTYRRTNPSAKKLTDEQILSILVNNGTIKLTADQKRSLFTNNSKQKDNTGLKLEVLRTDILNLMRRKHLSSIR